MKYFVLIAGMLIGCVFAVFLFFLRDFPLSFADAAPVFPSPSPYASLALVRHVQRPLANNVYRGSYVLLDAPYDINLSLNTEEKLTLRQAKDAQACLAVVNGGFYDIDGKPLGYFRQERKTVSRPRSNALFNAYLLLENGGKLHITQEGPGEEVISGVQSGPLLLSGGNPLTIRLHTDEHARRTVAATTTEGAFIFLSIYDPQSTFSGPLLSDLPNFVKQLEEPMGVRFAEAINLDGGSASGMVAEDFFLDELTYVGSYFCIR